MAGIFNGPARGGTRGGRDQFSWDNVKTDKDREFFLGHSVKATTGRWQKGRDVFWYTREVDRSEADAASELAMVKQREQDLMMEALGMKPKATKQLKQAQLDKADMQKLLQGSGEQEEAGSMAAAATAEANRIQGLGFNASMTTGAIQTGQHYEKLAGVGSGAAAPPAPQTQQATAAAQPQQPSGQWDGVPALTAEQIAELKQLRKKQEKKAAKKAHKAVMKAKKKTKKEKKKHRGGSSSGSNDDSDPPEREIHRGRSREETAEGSGVRRSVALVHGLSPRRGLGMHPPRGHRKSYSPEHRQHRKQQHRPAGERRGQRAPSRSRSRSPRRR
ncbi:hypothetical protein ABPG75_002677 [Micractinium tetrahymenae]